MQLEFFGQTQFISYSRSKFGNNKPFKFISTLWVTQNVGIFFIRFYDVVFNAKNDDANEI